MEFPGSARWGRTRSAAARAAPVGLRIPERARGSHRVGTPRFRPSGIIRRRPRAHSDAPAAPGATRESSRPSSAHRPVASGRRAKKASAARSTVRPQNSADRTFPPGRLPASSTMTRGRPPASAPGSDPRSSASCHAAASPAMPPPTTAMTGRRSASPSGCIAPVGTPPITVRRPRRHGPPRPAWPRRPDRR